MIVAMRKHVGDVIALVLLFVVGVGVAGYILDNQRLRFPLVEEKPFILEAELADAQAVQPGQGQTVRVAGIEIGQIGKVELDEGMAVVELQLEPKYEGFIKDDASALLRSKTGLKDMFLEVDPGDGEPLEDGGRIQVDEQRAGHRPGRVPLGARHRHARLPADADHGRRQGPRRRRRQGPAGGARAARPAPPRPGVGERRRRAPARQPGAAREPVRAADDRARHRARGHPAARPGLRAGARRVRGRGAGPVRVRRPAPGRAAREPHRARQARPPQRHDAAGAQRAAAAVPQARRGERRGAAARPRGHADRARRDPAVRARRRARSSRTSATRPRG